MGLKTVKGGYEHDKKTASCCQLSSSFQSLEFNAPVGLPKVFASDKVVCR